MASRWTFSRRTRPGPRSKRTRATSPSRTTRPSCTVTGRSTPLGPCAGARGRRTTTREASSGSTISPASVPWKRASTPRARAAGERSSRAIDSRSKSKRSWGTLCCSWLERSTIPGTSRRRRSASAARPRRTARSGPKIFTARLVLLPEIMWSMRWEIGWPKVTAAPGTRATDRRISASSSALGRPSRSTTSISDALTPCTCSSFSARPVRRLVETTSGKTISAEPCWPKAGSAASEPAEDPADVRHSLRPPPGHKGEGRDEGRPGEARACRRRSRS